MQTRLQIKKLSECGFAHFVVPVLLFVALFAITGSYLYLQSSHAAAKYYTFKSGIAGKCLDDLSDASKNGTTVDLYTCNTSAAQRWNINSNGTIENTNGKCIDNWQAKKVNGNPIRMITCSSTDAAQKWQSIGNVLKNPATGKCIDDPYFSTTNAKPLQLYTCNGGRNQKWVATLLSGKTNTGTGTPTPTTAAICSKPVYTTTSGSSTWNYASNTVVNNNVWGGTGSWTQTLKACSSSSWNVAANFKADGGAIQSYPDSEFKISGKTVAQYSSLQTCFGETGPTPAGGEYDYAYDSWLNNFGIEVMVWNNWTDTGIYPPSSARAVTINGVAYHEFKGGGANEWIYTRDTRATSGCFDMLGIFKDLVAHPSTSGITNSSTPNAIEYGVEIASTNGAETFQINNATLNAK